MHRYLHLSAPEQIERLDDQPGPMERLRYRDRFQRLRSCRDLEPDEPNHCDEIGTVAPSVISFCGPGLECLPGETLDLLQQRAGPVLSRTTGIRPMITVTNLSPPRVWRHACPHPRHRRRRTATSLAAGPRPAAHARASQRRTASLAKPSSPQRRHQWTGSLIPAGQNNAVRVRAPS